VVERAGGSIAIYGNSRGFGSGKFGLIMGMRMRLADALLRSLLRYQIIWHVPSVMVNAVAYAITGLVLGPMSVSSILYSFTYTVVDRKTVQISPACQIPHHDERHSGLPRPRLGRWCDRVHRRSRSMRVGLVSLDNRRSGWKLWGLGVTASVILRS
jgi:hypothetical protein